jgi:transcriptional regulator with XRE-family HTH domain
MAISHIRLYNFGMIKIGGIELNPEGFGQFVARRREAVGFKTQKSLALALNKDVSTIGKIETGDRIPSFDLFFALAEQLKTHPLTLLKELLVLPEQDLEVKELNELLSLLPEEARKQIRDFAAFLVAQNKSQS